MTDATTPEPGPASPTAGDDLKILDIAPDEGFRCPFITCQFKGHKQKGLDATVYDRSKHEGRYYLPPAAREALKEHCTRYRIEHDLLPWPEMAWPPIPKAERREVKKREDPPPAHIVQDLKQVSGKVHIDPETDAPVVPVWANGEMKECPVYELESNIKDHPEAYPTGLLEQVQEAISEYEESKVEDSGENDAPTIVEMGARTQIDGLGPGELFIDDDGRYGFAEVDGTNIHIRNMDEWEDYEKGARLAISARGKEVSGFYPLPGRPNIDVNDITLLRDLIQSIHPIVEFPGRYDLDEAKDDGTISRYDSMFAAWIAASYLKDHFAVNPRIGLTGITKSGKGRAQWAVRFHAYHALNIGSPTSAVMFRSVSWYGCTLALDEIQDFIENKERFADILDIIKLGYDKTPVARMGNNNKEIDLFNTNGYLIYSTKVWTPPEDVLNRGVSITMSKHRRPVMPDTPTDGPEYRKLRARLTALRLRAMAGIIDMKAIRTKAAAWVDKPIVVDGIATKLEDREAEIGRVLIASCIAAGGSEEDIEDIRHVLMASVIDANEALQETMPGRVFYALQAIVDQGKKKSGIAFDPSGISTLEVKEQLNTDLIQMGNAGKWEIKTREVTEALKPMGFRFKVGTGRKSFFMADSFERVYKLNLEKFGKRG